MITINKKPLGVILLSSLLSACGATTGLVDLNSPKAGFGPVSEQIKQVSGKRTVWVQSKEQADQISKEVHGLVHKKTISASRAVQVALLNNKGLQASYAELGLSVADLWQQSLLPNPKISIGFLGIDTPGLGAYRAIEGLLAQNILALFTYGARVDMADARFRQAQKKAILETLRLAGDTRRAWLEAVSAFETVYYLNQAQNTADAASELAQKLGESGALTKARQAREHVFYAELTGQRAQARLNAKLAKEKLTRLMGLWGQNVDYYVPDLLPGLPKRKSRTRAIEAKALKNRVDLKIAKLELEALAKSYGLTNATRLLSDLDIVGGFESERELEDGERKTVTTPQVEIEFVIPIFDSGEAKKRKAELAYMRAANQLAQKAVNIRSEARSAYMAYGSKYDIARHYKNNVLPLRVKIEEEGLLTYNGMITNTFELLADTRAKINAILLATNAKRDFWLSKVDLMDAIYVGASPAGSGGENMAVAQGEAAGH